MTTSTQGYASCSHNPQTSYGSDEASLLNTVHKLEQDISDLKSQSQITEQQHAAILTHVLSNYVVLESRFNATMDQLKQVAVQALESDTQVNQTAYMYTQQLEQKIEALESQIQTNDEKNAAVISNVLAQLTSSTAKQLVVQNQLNVTSQKLNTFTQHYKEQVGFEAKAWPSVIPLRTVSILKFRDVSINAGGGYNTSTGVFTAPVSGSYMFWFNIAVHTSQSYSIHLLLSGKTVGTYTGAVPPQPVAGIKNTDVTADGIMLVSLAKNDEMSCMFMGHGMLTRDSSLGGVLLTQDT